MHHQRLTPHLYQPDGKDIIVERPAYEFLRENARTVDRLAITGWVAFTEQFTSAPKPFEKLEGAAAKHNNLASYWTFLGAADGVVCFYCGVFPQNAPVDHLIPWAFVLEDKVWNLVLACASCNGAKNPAQLRARPTPSDFNDQNGKLIAKSSETLPPFISRELAEWRARSLRDPRVLLAERCLLDVFPEWCR